MAGEWKRTSLREAGVTLIDCDHRTPPAADSGYPYVAIPQFKEGRLALADARHISPEHFADWMRKAKPQHHDVILSRRCHSGETADGGAYPAVRPEVIGAMQVALPNEPKILDAFHCICGPLFEQAEANRTPSRTLATLRDTLLPKLLSGELSVAGIESRLEAVT